jgi:hypothetical protein
LIDLRYALSDRCSDQDFKSVLARFRCATRSPQIQATPEPKANNLSASAVD